MVQINFAHKEIQCKVVYYGPGMSGKTTNLEVVHEKTPTDNRGELTSIATTGERTLYFDYMPLDLGAIAGIKTKFQLYTVPGQIYYKSTRRLVLQGVDGIVFVADSSRSKVEENRESMRDLEDNLKEMGRSLTDVPIVIQYNKRDLPDAMTVEELQKLVNPHGFPYFEAVAPKGNGVFPTLKALATLVLDAVNRGGLGSARPPKTTAPAGAPTGTSVPAPTPVAASTSSAPAPRAPAPAPAPAPRPAQAPVAASAPRPAPAPAPARTAVAASAPATAVAAAPSFGATGTAVAPRPTPVPPPAPVVTTTGAPPFRPPPAPTHAAPAPTSAAASPSARPMNERLVHVSGLSRGGGGGGGKLVWIVGLVALIGAAAWFVLTKMGR